MALKKYRLPVSVGVHAPELDEPEIRDLVTGALITPYRKGVAYRGPGELVELEEEQAERIIAVHGTFEAWEARRNAPRIDDSTRHLR